MQKNYNFPAFLIVGAMKSGTSTLQQYLVRHPLVAIPDYEVHYFDIDDNYKKGDNWYKQQFPINTDTQITGEKTPAYSLHPKVSRRIYNLNPQTKLIWILRNPVARTYSNYLHAVKKGAEKNSFEKALLEEESRTNSNYILDYKKRSMYYNQIKHFLEIFSLDKMHFILFEDFIKSPQNELDSLCDFLEIKKINFKKIIKAHKSYLPFSVNLQYYSRNILGKENILYKGINRFNRFFSSKKPKMNIQTSNKLNKYFKKENKKLAKLINKDLAVWEVN